LFSESYRTTDISTFALSHIGPFDPIEEFKESSMFRSFLPGASACFCFDGDGFELPCSAVCARSSTRRPLPKLRRRSASSAWLVCFFLTGWVKLAPNPLSFLYACSSFPTAADAERPCRRLSATVRRAAEDNEPHVTGEGITSKHRRQD